MNLYLISRMAYRTPADMKAAIELLKENYQVVNSGVNMALQGFVYETAEEIPEEIMGTLQITNFV